MQFGKALDEILSKYKDNYTVYGLMSNKPFQKEVEQLGLLELYYL